VFSLAELRALGIFAEYGTPNVSYQQARDSIPKREAK
jgi:hypothetical protein